MTKKENMTEYLVNSEDESDFDGQSFSATTLAEELVYHNLRQLVDKDLLGKVDLWHTKGFRANLNSAIRQYPNA
jgi:hypothetical protein